MKESVFKSEKGKRLLEMVFLFVLIAYPMRHVNWGLDLWDTGYNYGNFSFLGEGYLDPMWFFSTYLANVVGHALTLLPFGKTLIGMNVYTGLQVSLLGVMGYLFCTKTLQMPKWLAFCGEYLAISLCWCPTALLYNYLTYILFLGAVILLYKGLSQEKNRYLFCAGILLATNILVRFSNLPEAGLVLAVWAYGVLDGMEQKKNPFGKIWKDTLWCLGGYVTGLVVWFGFIAVRYGIGEYVGAIQRLFGMTGNASDYTAISMIRGIIMPYINMIYWVIRIGVFAFAAVLLMCMVRYLPRLIRDEKLQKPVALASLWAGRVGATGIMGVLFYWLYKKEFCSFRLYSYDAMLMPAILCMTFVIAVAVVRIFTPKVSKEEKLLSGLVILVLFLTSIGSNNGLYPSINNWFVAAPYMLWQLYRFSLWAKEKAFVKPVSFSKFQIYFMPVAAVCWMILLFCAVQFVSFGAGFQFAEATGVQNIGYQAKDIKALKGISMSAEKAGQMQELNDYLEKNALKEKEILLFGKIPSMAFYLDMVPFFNTWSDLDSYDGAVMEAELKRLSGEIRDGKEDKPVVLVKRSGMDEENPKWNMIQQFIDEQNLQVYLVNEAFMLWYE